MEGFGLTVAEAMIVRAAVVVSDRGSLPSSSWTGEGWLPRRPVRPRRVRPEDAPLMRDPCSAESSAPRTASAWTGSTAGSLCRATTRVYEEVLERLAPTGRHAWTAPVSARWPRPIVAVVDVVNRRGKAVGVRLVRYTGRARHLIHPKHLVNHRGTTGTLSTSTRGRRPRRGLRQRRATRSKGPGVCAGRRMDYDVAQLPVAATEARALGLKKRAPLRVGSRTTFPFADRSFDVSAVPRLIEHLHPRLEVLGEIRRVLKSSGRLLVSGRTATPRGGGGCARPGSSRSPIRSQVEYTEAEFIASCARWV